MSAPTQIQVAVSSQPRGPGNQSETTLAVQSYHGSFAWGGSPSSATLVYIGDFPIETGALVLINGSGHFFAGMCISDTSKSSSRGATRELEFRDMREFLSWDYTFCAFNMVERRIVDGVWTKRWWHIYPNDFDTYTKTYTDSPLDAWEIVNAILLGPTIGTPWTWDFTGFGLFREGLLNAPIYTFDCLQGKRLDAALNEISAAGGLVFGLFAAPHDYYHLVWMRKGYGILPSFPPNADDQRLGIALSGNATNVRVLGGRNKYQILNMAMQPDWQPAWDTFLAVDSLAEDLFENEKDPASGVRYNAFPSDPQQWLGRFAAKIRALEITVSEYAALRNARAGDGNQFLDPRKFNGRSRNDMPAALYIQNLIFRAYKPAFTGIQNIRGDFIPLDSTIIDDKMLCRVTYDPTTGAMQDDPTTLSDGNGLVILQGWQFGQDFFKLVNPERITGQMFTANKRYWAASSFQIDDSLEGDRFIILDAPAFTSENLFTTINGITVLNAAFTLNIAPCQAALTFLAEPYSYWRGTYPNVSRDRVEYVSDLCQEFSGTGPSDYEEILYASGENANEQAQVIADSLLLSQYAYINGGYNLKMNPLFSGGGIGTGLNSVIDRVEVESGPHGIFEVVDWTSERLRNYFEPERDLERKTQNNSLFPGQSELKETARDYKRFAAAIKATPSNIFDLFMRFLSGNFTNSDMIQVVVKSGSGTVNAGTPFFQPPMDNTAPAPLGKQVTSPLTVSPASTDSVFAGVSVRDQENATGPFYVKTGGKVYCRVEGPVNSGGLLVGLQNSDFLIAVGNTGGGSLVPGTTPVATAMQTISDTSTKLIAVQLNGVGQTGMDLANPMEYDMTKAYPGKTWVHVGSSNAAATAGTTDPISEVTVKSAAGWYCSAPGGVPIAGTTDSPQYHIPQVPLPDAGTVDDATKNFWMMFLPDGQCYS